MAIQPTLARLPFGRITAPEGDYKAALDTLQARLLQAQLPQLVRVVRADTDAKVTDQTLAIDPDANGGAITVTLSDPSRVKYGVWTFKQITAGTVTISGTVDGVTDPTLTAQWQSITVQSDGTQYLKLAAVP